MILEITWKCNQLVSKERFVVLYTADIYQIAFSFFLRLCGNQETSTYIGLPLSYVESISSKYFSYYLFVSLGRSKLSHHCSSYPQRIYRCLLLTPAVYVITILSRRRQVCNAYSHNHRPLLQCFDADLDRQ